MAHATARAAYAALTERLNQAPQGAPPSELLYRILELLFTEKEAGLVARLPMRPVTFRNTLASREEPGRASNRFLADEGASLTRHCATPCK